MAFDKVAWQRNWARKNREKVRRGSLISMRGQRAKKSMYLNNEPIVPVECLWQNTANETEKPMNCEVCGEPTELETSARCVECITFWGQTPIYNIRKIEELCAKIGGLDNET